MSEQPTLSDKVKTWVEKTGLPLELHAFAEFKSAGFLAEHSSVYSDPESDKGREIDVVAYSRDPMGLLYLFAVAECKASPNPWVVLVNRGDPSIGMFSSLGIVEKRAQKMLPDSFLHHGETAFSLKARFNGGYGLRQAFSNDSDPAYGASMSVLKASIAVVNNFSLAKTARFLFAIPVIVVEAPIFECSFNVAGGLSLLPVDSSEFVFTAHVPERTRATIRIVHRRALKGFAAWLWRLATTKKVQLQPEMEALLKTLEKGNQKGSEG